MIYMASTRPTDSDFLAATTAANALEGCNCQPVAFKDEDTGLWDFQHLPDCTWRGPHPLTALTCRN